MSANSIANGVFIAAFFVFMLLPIKSKYVIHHLVALVMAVSAAIAGEGWYVWAGLMVLLMAVILVALHLAARKAERGDN